MTYFPRPFGSWKFGSKKYSYGEEVPASLITAAQTLPAFTQVALISRFVDLNAAQTLPAFTQVALISRFVDLNAAQTLPAFVNQVDLRTVFWFDTSPPADCSGWDGEKLPCGGAWDPGPAAAGDWSGETLPGCEWVADPAGGSDWGVR